MALLAVAGPPAPGGVGPRGRVLAVVHLARRPGRRLARPARPGHRRAAAAGRSSTSGSPATRCSRCTPRATSPTSSTATAGWRDVPGSFVSFVVDAARPPVALAALAGVVLAWRLGAGPALGARADRALRRRRPDLRRDRRRGALGAAALPDRAGGRGLHRRRLRRRSASRRSRRGGCGAWWRRAAVAAAVLGAGVRRRQGAGRSTASSPSCASSADAHELHRDARRRRRCGGRRCGPITFPNYRLVPDTRWMLDLPRTRGRRAQRAAPHARRRDLRHRAQGARALRLRRGRVPRRRTSPTPGFVPIARNGALRGVRALPRRARRSRRRRSPAPRSRSHNGPFCARAVCASAQARSSASGRARAPANARSAAAKASASSATSTARAHVRTPASVGRHRAAAEAGVLDDPVGQRGVVERLDPERHDPDVGAQDQPCGRLVVQRARARRTAPSRARRRSPRRPCTRPRATAPTSSSTRSSPQALGHRAQQRPVRPPAEVAERDRDDRRRRSGAGNESAASGTSVGLAAGRLLEADQLVGPERSAARSAAASCSAARRARRRGDAS